MIFLIALLTPLSFCCMIMIGTFTIIIVKAMKLTSLITPIIRYSCATAERKNVANNATDLFTFLLLKG